ncbi:hypothetical protein HNE05_08260 [Aquipseudomonas campi]|uniref:Uncharacterized protein n=1 Tax=Aquipseudomonas campi TaxID=2731681 RepID=A0A6M8FET7_9GAMM|nr:hypothetical protein HNE05_08260 [Pseudomonas campi]
MQGRRDIDTLPTSVANSLPINRLHLCDGEYAGLRMLLITAQTLQISPCARQGAHRDLYESRKGTGFQAFLTATATACSSTIPNRSAPCRHQALSPSILLAALPHAESCTIAPLSRLRARFLDLIRDLHRQHHHAIRGQTPVRERFRQVRRRQPLRPDRG